MNGEINQLFHRVCNAGNLDGVQRMVWSGHVSADTIVFEAGRIWSLRSDIYFAKGVKIWPDIAKLMIDGLVALSLAHLNQLDAGLLEWWMAGGGSTAWYERLGQM